MGGHWKPVYMLDLNFMGVTQKWFSAWHSAKSPVTLRAITADEAGQRIDNFLMRHFKTVPRSRVYRLLRKGEVRVNRKRVDAEYRIQEGDEVRLPPVRIDAGD